MFLLYLLLHRLECKLPTLVQFVRERFHVFREEGVSTWKSSAAWSEVIPNLEHHEESRYWALCDSNQSVEVPCSACLAIDVRTIHFTSAKPERWKKWAKQRGAMLYVMGLPQKTEITVIA